MGLTLILLAGMVYVTGRCFNSSAEIVALRASNERTRQHWTADRGVLYRSAFENIDGKGSRGREDPAESGLVEVLVNISIAEQSIDDESRCLVSHSISRSIQSKQSDRRDVLYAHVLASFYSLWMQVFSSTFGEIARWRQFLDHIDMGDELIDQRWPFAEISEHKTSFGKECSWFIETFLGSTVHGRERLDYSLVRSIRLFSLLYYADQICRFYKEIRTIGFEPKSRDGDHLSAGLGAIACSISGFRCDLNILGIRSYGEIQLGVSSSDHSFRRLYLFIGRYLQSAGRLHQLACENRDQDSRGSRNPSEANHPWRLGVAVLIVGTGRLCWSARRPGRVQLSYALLGSALYQAGCFILAYGSQWGLTW
jgi:hypothetical protein